MFLFSLIILSSCTDSGKDPFFLDWRFHLGDFEDARMPEFDDTQWVEVNIPHDWSIEQSFTKENTAASTGFLPGGIGWYRKHFVLENSPEGKHVRVGFDGVYNNSTVWINGVKLGERPYGYSSFSYEMNEYLNPAGEEGRIVISATASEIESESITIKINAK